MSHLLWKYYWENDVDRFRRLLAPAGSSSHPAASFPSTGATGGAFTSGSPGSIASSPRTTPRPRKALAHTPGTGRFKEGGAGLSRNEINSRDHAGLTVLLRAASSTHPNARGFVQALLDHPLLDLYAQDPESGWNALHRSLYTGNVSIARLLLAKERIHLTTNTNQAAVWKVGQLIKTKDNEGNSPFDVYNSTIATAAIYHEPRTCALKNVSATIYDMIPGEDDSEVDDDTIEIAEGIARQSVMGDEFFMFGSNKNLSLGVGDEDDRQYPERVALQRPDALLHRFHNVYLDEKDVDTASSALKDVPTLIRHPPLAISDIVMSKLHTAVLTHDPVSNLYICGVGRGGRLGMGDENTQFRFVPVEGPFADRKVVNAALGQNHSMAVTDNGELWTWGLNSDSQLGYVLPPMMRSDQEPMSLTPRQVFGPLKKEIVQGIAASAVHSVAHTGFALYCWGRNLGQLALMDADSRSLEFQTTPRKVAASLLSATILMVSAIDKATTCLLSNNTVWVFTNYGYNLVKFPYPDVFSNSVMGAGANALNHVRLDSRRRIIRHIASGDETIAAITSSGDLFTMQLNTKVDANQVAAGSTTNPVKIKGAVTQPQCIWDSRKDGVASVSVGEHGSVIICTESGAVWRRVKRPKGKNAILPNSTDVKKKDFKFERVPYITNCISVRSSTFGAFSAIRQNSRVMSCDIAVAKQSIWDDVGALLCLNKFQASLTESAEERTIRNERHSAGAGTLPHEIIRSLDIEHDMLQWISTNSFQCQDLNMELRASPNPDLRIPVHSWVLSGRSPLLRAALSEYSVNASMDAYSDIFSIEQSGTKTILTFIGVDVYTLLNLVVYVYLDAIIPVWRCTRERPSLAHRFRQVRTDLMKLGTRLQMPKLEAAARLQEGLELSLDANFRDAIADPAFFHDADMIIELDGDEVHAHSDLICQRCPFFNGMFRGRSQGQWLTGRRNPLLGEDLVRVDLKHINPEIFDYVMRYLYGDVGVELFNDVCLETLDEFSELVLDVMGVANELMLDRLSQICQCLLGKFVTTRNIANLLNEISPCSVTEFKDAGLEYICLQLESMLENHLLDGLDQDLLLELDEVVRSNQLAQFPYVRSGRADSLLHDQYPDLALDIEEERRRRVKAMAFKLAQKDEERKLSSSYKARVGSLDDASTPQPHAQDRARRKSSKVERSESLSPNLRAVASHTDLMFNMEDEDGPNPITSMSPGMAATATDGQVEIDLDNIPRLPAAWRNAQTNVGSPLGRSPGLDAMSPSQQLPGPGFPLPSRGIDGQPTSPPARPTNAPWASPILPSSKLDLKNIMQEATSKSNLTAALTSQAEKAAGANRTQARISQKERKKQQLLQAEAEAAAEKDKAKEAIAWETVKPTARPPPWKAASPAPKTSLRDAMQSETVQSRGGSASTPAPTKSSLTVDGTGTPSVINRRVASPDTRFSGQSKARSSTAAPSIPEVGPSKPQEPKPLVPHSKSYMKPAPKAEAMLGYSMADIIGQQQLEQQRVKEAVAKRSLQEIQEEQAFQEWWDQESRRAQEAEARKQVRVAGKEREQSRSSRDSGGHRRGGGGGGGTGTGAGAGAGGGRKGRGGGKSKTAGSGEATKQAVGNAATSSRGGGRGGRGRGGGSISHSS